MPRRTLSTMMLVLLPPLALVVGVALQQVGRDAAEPPTLTLLALVVAAVVPMAASVALAIATPDFDVVLVSIAAMLAAIGTVSLFGLAQVPGSAQEFYATVAVRHGLFVGVGFGALVVAAAGASRLEALANFPFTILLAAFALTGVTVVLGQSVNGARLWLDTGFIRFQPSEVARVLLIVFMAIYLHERRHLVAAPWRVATLDLPPAPYLAPLGGAVLAAAAVLALQNDLGIAALIVLGAYVTVIGSLRSRSSATAAAALLIVMSLVAYSSVPRVRDRVVGWLDPWADPLGRGFQFVQADFSLANAGLLGGGDGSVAIRVPEVHTDFALVAIGTQFGLATLLAVIALAGVFVSRCLINGLRAAPGFGALLATSLAALFAIQIVLIAGGTLRVLPLTGLTFPLVSYGGTSMVVTLFALGLIVGLGARSGNAATPEAARA